MPCSTGYIPLYNPSLERRRPQIQTLIATSTRWPYRQDDPAWANDVMWSRGKVIEVHKRYNGASESAASRLLHPFDSGNTIGNETCLLTCLAMVLRLLASHDQHWTPSTLNRFGHDRHYYTPAGLAMTTLYADIVSDA